MQVLKNTPTFRACCSSTVASCFLHRLLKRIPAADLENDSCHIRYDMCIYIYTHLHCIHTCMYVSICACMYIDMYIHIAAVYALIWPSALPHAGA